jgi:hypothetical protein
MVGHARILCILALPTAVHSLLVAHGISSHPLSAAAAGARHRIRPLNLAVDDASASLLSAWERGDGALSLRARVEAAGKLPSVSAAAKAITASTARWEGLWVARIEHFEKVAFLGVDVRPHYQITSDGGLVSHVHGAWGPFKGWLSAAGSMKPSPEGGASVTLVFDDFWVGADGPGPRDAPPEPGASPLDALIRGLGRLLFFEGLAGFPVDYSDDANGLVAFRFTPLNSCIVAKRSPAGERPQRCI